MNPDRRAAREVWPAVAVGVAVLWACRWAAGPTFGYTIGVTAVMPLSAAWVGRSTPGPHGRVACGVMTFAAVVPWLTDEPPATAGRLALLLVGWVAAVGGGLRLATSLLPRQAAAAIVVSAWVSWLTVPLVRTDALSVLISEDGLAYILTLNPLLTANAATPTAADWTHQALAYRWLTPLGQDIAFDLEMGVGRAVCVHVGVGLALYLLGTAFVRVPRGTVLRPSSGPV